jgi:hypothetical protein
MTIHLNWIFCISFTAILVAGEARGQSSRDDIAAQWRRVQSVPSGEQVEVRRLSGQKVKGTVISTADDGLTIKAETGQLNIPRSEIRQVKVRRRSANLKRGAIGAAIGAASGVVVVVALDGALTDGNGVAEDAAAILGAIGAGIGFLAGVIPSGFITIYKAN